MVIQYRVEWRSHWSRDCVVYSWVLAPPSCGLLFESCVVVCERANVVTVISWTCDFILQQESSWLIRLDFRCCCSSLWWWRPCPVGAKDPFPLLAGLLRNI